MSQVQPATPNPADAYEQGLVSNVFGPLADAVLQRIPPDPDDRLLDVACGTGIVLRRAARFLNGSRPLTGIDMNPMMIGKAREKCIAETVPAGFDVALADALPFADESFTIAYCQHGMQFFPDRPAALGEIRRVLQRDGRLVVTTWAGLDRHPYFAAIDEITFQHVGMHVVAGPFSLGDERMLTDMLADAGFRDISAERLTLTTRFRDGEAALRMQIEGALAAIPSLRHLGGEQQPEIVQGILREVRPVLDRFTEDGALLLDWHAIVTTGRR